MPIQFAHFASRERDNLVFIPLDERDERGEKKKKAKNVEVLHNLLLPAGLISPVYQWRLRLRLSLYLSVPHCTRICVEAAAVIHSTGIKNKKAS